MVSFDQYLPGRLGLGGEEEFARRLWAFLNTPEIVERMITATDLGHPAVEGIRDQLVQTFGAEMTIERNRQRAGHMARQIMEMNGFEIEKTEVKVNAFPFSKAARYRRRGGFVLHVFRASTDPRELCITDKRDASGFPPPTRGKWIHWTCVTSDIQAAVAFDITDTPALRATIERDGFVALRLRRMLRAAG